MFVTTFVSAAITRQACAVDVAPGVFKADLARAPQQVIGMREVQALRAGEMGEGALEEALNVRTRRLARMQGTWMRKMAPDVVIDLGDAPAIDAVGEVLGAWHHARGEVG